ncbi:MAG TPA: heparan-alpha-glucosaminide N-acetyltransferase [Methanoregulaceae archaeon]|nr:heparan-alpha-glucosaminide N-acetyltransferase [Methanoregulaceae archaeon]
MTILRREEGYIFMTVSHVPERYPEIDIARGIAVVMMVVFHIAFDLSFLGIAAIPVGSPPWRVFAMATAALFLLLVGISLSISSGYARTRLSRSDFTLKYLKRGAGIFAIGVGISIVTWIILPGAFIVFGILHLIGLSIALSPLYSRYSWQNLLAGLGIILFSPAVAAMRGDGWLVWLGIHPPAFYSIDYTPVFPWFGVVLIGVFLGTILYPRAARRWDHEVPTLPGSPLRYLGRHSLAIYLIHQPVILGILFVAFPGAFSAFVPPLPG